MANMATNFLISVVMIIISWKLFLPRKESYFVSLNPALAIWVSLANGFVSLNPGLSIWVSLANGTLKTMMQTEIWKVLVHWHVLSFIITTIQHIIESGVFCSMMWAMEIIMLGDGKPAIRYIGPCSPNYLKRESWKKKCLFVALGI